MRALPVTLSRKFLAYNAVTGGDKNLAASDFKGAVSLRSIINVSWQRVASWSVSCPHRRSLSAG